MNVTDHKCADVLARTGPITAGELARITGLTTGAITGVIDRLEQAGFVRRAKDPDDRRRVVIEPNVERMQRVIGPLFESMARSATALCERYSTEQLAVIRDFTRRAREMADEQTRQLREETPAVKRPKKAKPKKQ
jgi:DNA-binding MarR family transcriptional regulator